MLDSTESDDERDIENIMNDSDTEFVAEYESVISTNIIRKEEIGDQSSSVSVLEASIQILSTQNKNETGTLGHDEPNSAPATQCTSNQSPSPAIHRTANQSPTAASQHASDQSPTLPFNVLLISHLLLLLDVLPNSHPNLLLHLQLLYPKTPRNGSKAQRSKTKRKRKRSMLHLTRTTQTRKGAVLARQDKTKKKKNNMTEEWKWEDKEKQAYDEKEMYVRGRGTHRS